MKKELAFYTDGSKMDIGTGAGVYCKALGINHSFRIHDDCSVFQAEVTAIIQAAEIIRESNIVGKTITVYIDSQAAVKALDSAVIRSRLVRICKSLLNEISRANAVTLCWVPGHMDIKGNEKADELARKGSALHLSRALPFVVTPISSLRKKIEDEAIGRANRRWVHLETCATARALWPAFSKKRSTSLVKLSRYNARVVSGIITGHCAIGVHAERLGVLHNDFCRSCRDEEEIESVRHLLCDCPALSVIRMRTLGSYFFSELEDLGNVELTDLLRFISLSGWF